MSVTNEPTYRKSREIHLVTDYEGKIYSGKGNELLRTLNMM